MVISELKTGDSRGKRTTGTNDIFKNKDCFQGNVPQRKEINEKITQLKRKS